MNSLLWNGLTHPDAIDYNSILQRHHVRTRRTSLVLQSQIELFSLHRLSPIRPEPSLTNNAGAYKDSLRPLVELNCPIGFHLAKSADNIIVIDTGIRDL